MCFHDQTIAHPSLTTIVQIKMKPDELNNQTSYRLIQAQVVQNESVNHIKQ